MRITRGSIFLPLAGGLMSGAIDFPSSLTDIITYGGGASRFLGFSGGPRLHIGNTGNGLHLTAPANSLYRGTATTDELLSNLVHAGLTHIRKSVDEIVNNSTVNQNDDELLFAVIANEVTEFEFLLYVLTTVVADFKYAVVLPAAATLTFAEETSIAGDAAALIAAKRTGGVQLNYTGAGPVVLRLRGVYFGGANAGNVQLQWAQNTAEVSDTTVQAGSLLTARRMS